MILEGIVTTLDADGRINIAPMGPRVEHDFRHFLLRPFRGSNTYRNLAASREGVLHVTDDVLLLARSAIGNVSDAPTRAAETVNGRVLLDCCRYYEFRVTAIDDRDERVGMQAETVHEGRIRDLFGFNRAKHAVLEAAILATRVHLLDFNGIVEELKKLRLVVEKTGGHQETEAFDLLENHIRSVAIQP